MRNLHRIEDGHRLIVVPGLLAFPSNFAEIAAGPLAKTIHPA